MTTPDKIEEVDAVPDNWYIKSNFLGGIILMKWRRSGMLKKNISLTTVEQIKNFVAAVNRFDFEVDLLSGRYHVNGKSIIGICSLDLTQDICLEAQVPGDKESSFLKAIEPFVV